MYLWRRPGGFTFQLRIPSGFRESFGRTPLRARLGPVAATEAQRRAAILAGHCHGLLLDPTMTRPTLDKSLAALAAELRDLDRAGRWAALKASSAASQADDEPTHDDPASRELAAHLRTEAAAHRARKVALGSIRSRLESLGTVLDRDDVAWSAERATYRETLADLHAAERREVSPALVPPPAQPAPPPVPDGPTADSLLSVVAAPIVKARRDALDQGGDSASRYGERVQQALAAFLEIVGDKPLRAYLPSDVQEFANVLGRVPSNRHKLKAFAGLTARKAADANDRLPPDQRRARLSSSAVKGYVADFLPTWRAVAATVPGVRDLGAVKVTAPRAAAPAVTREGLSVEALNVWLADAATHADPHMRWLPLLGLLTGMRIAEMVHLQGRDVRQVDGNTVIDLRGTLLVDGVEAPRPLKTTTSSRIVALHPVLTDLGFVAWAQGVDGFLFPGFHVVRDPADAAQKRMGHWMRRLGIAERQKGVFHSLRHNAKAWLRPHVGDRTIDFQCGHAPATTGAKYGFRTLTADEVEAIERAPPPRGIDFSPYREAPSRSMPKAKASRPTPRFRDVPNLSELRARTPAKAKRGRRASA
ncbi:hypothetical protein NS226_04065 [Aureimonas ureilytica]|uniref:Tyr recombinase domain-containing protein n=2 Tax=Aureimonas ureilytica TaxID=401562 RepID=A0A175RCD6_9HYPH|nr:hypothetical protein NS226_04065 [Aureimonas ureilytica]